MRKNDNNIALWLDGFVTSFTTLLEIVESYNYYIVCNNEAINTGKIINKNNNNYIYLKSYIQ